MKLRNQKGDTVLLKFRNRPRQIRNLLEQGFTVVGEPLSGEFPTCPQCGEPLVCLAACHLWYHAESEPQKATRSRKKPRTAPVPRGKQQETATKDGEGEEAAE